MDAATLKLFKSSLRKALEQNPVPFNISLVRRLLLQGACGTHGTSTSPDTRDLQSTTRGRCRGRDSALGVFKSDQGVLLGDFAKKDQMGPTACVLDWRLSLETSSPATEA